ncbi:hypothetical protein, partial [Campylobacter jejuni]|uniref:hypothetical protein n=1 Tax=Campylobacter jejuni TaxID=197 RepID=UPI001A8FC005
SPFFKKVQSLRKIDDNATTVKISKLSIKIIKALLSPVFINNPMPIDSMNIKIAFVGIFVNITIFLKKSFFFLLIL